MTFAVVSAIQPKLLQTEIAMATRRRPENLTGYDFYRRALPQFYLSTREGIAEAVRLAHRFGAGPSVRLGPRTDLPDEAGQELSLTRRARPGAGGSNQ